MMVLRHYFSAAIVLQAGRLIPLRKKLFLGDWDFYEIDLTDMELFNQYIRESVCPVSLWSSNFAFLWAISHSEHQTVLWRIVDSMLAVFIHTDDDMLYLRCIPFGKGNADHVVGVITKCLNTCEVWNKKNMRPEPKKAQVKMLNEQQLGFLKQNKEFKKLYKVVTWQGIERHYSIPELNELKGKNFADLRNRLSKFRRERPNAVISLYQKSDLNEVLALSSQWKKSAGQKYSHIFDGVYFKQLVTYNFELAQQILLIKLDGRIIGMIAGSALPTGQAWGSVLKYQEGYPGLSETLTVEFAKLLHRQNPKAEYLNVGSDLGSKGLRQYKLKFNPVLNLKRYRIVFKDTSETD